MLAQTLRDRIDEAAEREALAISKHYSEYRSVFCPIHLNVGRSKQLTLAEQLGVSLAGVVSYVRKMQG